MSLKSQSLSKDLKSFSYANNIINSNFINGITGWTVYSSVNTVVNNTLINTGDGGDAVCYARQDTTPIVVGNKIFFMARIRVTNPNCSRIELQIDGSTGGDNEVVDTKNLPSQNEWYLLSGIATVVATFTGNLKLLIFHIYPNAATANGKVMEVIEPFAIDLSLKYGAGNEPSAIDCANIFKFVDGTKQPNLSNILII